MEAMALPLPWSPSRTTDEARRDHSGARSSQIQQLHGHPCFVVRFWAAQPCPRQRCLGLKAKSQVTGQTSNRLQDVGAGGRGSWLLLAASTVFISRANLLRSNVQVDDS